MTREQLEQLKKQLRASGIKEGSAQWQAAINKGFYNGRSGGTNNSTSGKNFTKASKKEDASKYSVQGLAWLLRNYIQNGQINNMTPQRVDRETGKLIQEYLLHRGYDLGYVGADGSKKSGIYAADGSLGDKTIKALNQELATLKGSSANMYEKDFASKYKDGKTPTYNKVPGRSDADTELLSNLYYNYYRENPAYYAGLLEDPAQAAQVLPYLSEEAKSLLSENAMEKANYKEGVLNLPEMAYQGLLGPRGVELQQHWEKQNVAKAKDRGLADIMQQVSDVMAPGQRLMGRITGGKDEDMGGLTYDYTYNPVTRQMQQVVVPNKTTTVADNLGINNGSAMGTIGSFLVNTLTDPLSIAASVAAGDWIPNWSKPVRVAGSPGSAYRGVMVDAASGTPINGGVGNISVLTEAAPGKIIPGGTNIEGTVHSTLVKGGNTVPGKPSYHVQGNRVNGVGPRKSGGVNKLVSTSESNPKYVKPEYTTDVSIDAVEHPIYYRGPVYDYHRFPYILEQGNATITPYLAEHPSMTMYMKPSDYIYNPGLAFMPAAWGSAEAAEKPNFVSAQPEPDYVRFGYRDMPVGRNFYIKPLDSEQFIYDAPSSNTHNTIRAKQPQSGFLPVWWKGNYQMGQ